MTIKEKESEQLGTTLMSKAKSWLSKHMTKDEKIELLLQEINMLKKRVDNLTDFSLVTDNNIKTIHENIKILNKKLDLQSELIRLTRKQLDLLAGVEEGKL